MFEAHFRPSKALQAAIGLKEIWLELLSKIHHVGAERVQRVLLVGGDFREYLFDFEQNLVEDKDLFVHEFLGELLKYLTYQGQKLFT